AVTAAEARQALEVLNDPAKRAQMVTTLQVIAHTAPAKPPPAAAAQPKVALAPNSLGAALVAGVSGSADDVLARTVQAARSVQSIPLLWGWVVVMATNQLAHALLREALWRVALAVACGLVAEWVIRRLLRRPVAALEGWAPATMADQEQEQEESEQEVDPELNAESAEAAAERGETEPPPARYVAMATLLRRLPLVLIRLLLELLPVLGFAMAGHIVAASELGGSDQSRLIVLAMVDAYAISAGTMSFARMLLSPKARRLRLLRISDATAVWATRWIRRLTVVAVFGYAIAEVGLALGMSPPAHDGLLKIAGWILHVFLGIMVVQKRRPVRNWLRAPGQATGPFARFRNAVAAVWHWIALFFLVALWIAWAVEIRNGYSKVLHFFLSIVLVLVVARLALIVLLGSLERAGRVSPELLGRYPGLEDRLAFYHPVVQAVARAAVYIAAAVVLLELWGVPLVNWFSASLLGRRLVGGLGTLSLTIALAIAVWEAVNGAVQAHLARLTREQQAAPSARLRTLLPLFRTALFVALVVIAGLTVLSEIGIDIAPLLAGAGIIGVAIGFGSQKLVQDLITGIFLLLENAMQVGDWVTVSGLSGSVENLSVRTIRLRATDGAVHIIPFSAVTSVTNTNRGLGNAAVSATVAFGEDTDRVSKALQEIATELKREPDFASRMLSDLQLWGVDKVDGAAVTIAGQIVCTDSGRWPVQREFNRRMKKRFQERGIELFNPARTVMMPMPEAPTSPASQQSPSQPAASPHTLPQPVAAK
ncbi:MAG: mechanosensitive ion channel, partial [Pseudomonadota bacterium]|nr:mechanosensitive ion channel [Pseudomonadota bacterium]